MPRAKNKPCETAGILAADNARTLRQSEQLQRIYVE
jgi:hypothetical protein